MAQETGDLFAAASGSASLGVEQIGGGFTRDIRPYAHIHTNSGVFHNPSRGSSGIIRFQNDAWYPINGALISNEVNDYFGFSFDGGKNWPLEIGPSVNITGMGVDMLSPFGGLRWIGSGALSLISFEGTIGIGTFSGHGSGQITISTLSHENDVVVTTAGNDSDLRFETNGINSEIQLTTFAGDIIFDSASIINVVAAGDIIIDTNSDFDLSARMQVALSAFNGAGKLDYRVNQFQSWYIKTSHKSTGGPSNDGYWPIAHSGDVSQMIAQAGGGGTSTLQTAYNNGRVAVLTSSPGNLQLISNTAKPEFSTFGTMAELNISGLFTPPTLANLETGDFYMMNHSVISGIVAAKTAAVAKAQALGVGTLVVNTGSGIANVMIGSGIAQFGNSILQRITTTLTTVNLNTILQSADQNYGMGTGLNSGIITVFSPGLYKINYKMTIDKTVGTTPQHCQIRLEQSSNPGSAAFGSAINTMHFDSTNASLNTASTVLLLNLDAGESIKIMANSTLSGTNNCDVIARGATIMIEKVGPKRGAAGS